jgi:hypothetical protein
VQPVWEAVWSFCKKLKLELPYDPVKPLLGIYPKEGKIGYNRDTHIPVFIATLHYSQALETTLVHYCVGKGHWSVLYTTSPFCNVEPNFPVRLSDSIEPGFKFKTIPSGKCCLTLPQISEFLQILHIARFTGNGMHGTRLL